MEITPMKISTAESQVMEALWRSGPMTPDELVEAVGPSNGWARNTVRVLITRLVRKGAIKGGKEEGVFRYRSLLDRAEYVLAEGQSLLDRLFDGKLAPLVVHFARHRNLSPEEMEKLSALLAEIDSDGR
jgi:BlaI family penicillinase repressor